MGSWIQWYLEKNMNKGNKSKLNLWFVVILIISECVLSNTRRRQIRFPRRGVILTHTSRAGGCCLADWRAIFWQGYFNIINFSNLNQSAILPTLIYHHSLQTFKLFLKLSPERSLLFLVFCRFQRKFIFFVWSKIEKQEKKWLDSSGPWPIC